MLSSHLVGIPKVYWWGTQGDYNALVMELLGKSMEDLFFENNCKLSIKTIAVLADQMVVFKHQTRFKE